MEKKTVYVVLNQDSVSDICMPVQLFLSSGFEIKGIYTGSRKKEDIYRKLLRNFGAEELLEVTDTSQKIAGIAEKIDRENQEQQGEIYICTTGDLRLAKELLNKSKVLTKTAVLIWMGYRENNEELLKDMVKSGFRLWYIPAENAGKIRSSLAMFKRRLKACDSFAQQLCGYLEKELEEKELYRKNTVRMHALACAAVMFAPEYQKYEKRSFSLEDGNGYKFGNHGVVRVYEEIDNRMVLENFYAGINLYYSKERRIAYET